MKIKQSIKKYSHAWVLLYAIIYLPWFTHLEKQITEGYYLIHSPLDDYIPFVEYFIVPYLLWFAFIAVAAGYLFFTDKKGFYKLSAFLITGMTIFLIICTVFPNGQNLRPAVFANDNIFTDMVKSLYAADTPTNILPSIHVFNSLGVSFALAHNKVLKQKKWILYAVYTLTALIILSTVFLKQHSVTDVFAAFVLAGMIYPFVYATQAKKAPELSQQPT